MYQPTIVYPIYSVFLAALGCLSMCASAQAQFGNTSFRAGEMTPAGWQSAGQLWAQENDAPSAESQFEFESESEMETEERERIETERHDFTQSTKVVGCGVRQFEYGVLYTYKENGDERETGYATPELMFRYGLTDRTEFRMRFNYGWKFIDDEEDISGAEDLRLSFKSVLTEQCGWRPESAIELRTSAPTGTNGVSTDRWQGGLDLIYGYEFRERFSFTASTGVNGNALGEIAFLDPEGDPGDKFLAWTQSAALGAELSEKSTVYFEWFGIFTDGREDEASLNFLNIGVDRYLSDNVLIDFRVGWGLNDDSDDLFAGIGGAFRF